MFNGEGFPLLVIQLENSTQVRGLREHGLLSASWGRGVKTMSLNGVGERLGRPLRPSLQPYPWTLI